MQMVKIPIVKEFKGLVGDILNLDTGSTFRQPHNNGGDTDLVTFVTDDPNHYCKDCKTAICKNCGREMHKRDLNIGQDMTKKELAATRSEAIDGLEPNEYEEYINGRFEPLDKTPWFRKCKDSTTCEAYKHSKIEKNSSRIFSSGAGKFQYYDNSPDVGVEYNRKTDPNPIYRQCKRCGGDIKQKTLTSTNRHPLWGTICKDCSDVLRGGGY